MNESNGGDVWIVPLDVSHEPYAFLETRFNEYAAFSPDGDFMVVQSDESGQNEVYIAPFPGPGRKLQVSIDGGTSPRFRADGRAIFYQHADNQVVTVALERRGDVFEIGAVTPLFDVSGFSNTESSWWPSPDGQEFLVARPAQQEHPPLSLVVNWTEMLRAP
jgi:hypothetical protein